MAAYGLTSLLLAVFVAILWVGGLDRARLKSNELLALRLFPAGAAAVLAVTVVLPAFLIYEPAHELEEGGPLLVGLAMVALLVVGDGIRRGWRARVSTWTLSRDWGPAERRTVTAGQNVDVVDVPQPIVAVVGAWRPRIIASQCVVTACTTNEFRQVIAHEAAHIATRDNLKLLLLVLSPDMLAWLPPGAALAARWRAAAELEADERATGSDRHKRVALASALIKVARLGTGMGRRRPALIMPIAEDDVDGRVRQLLSLSPGLARAAGVWGLVPCMLLVSMIGVPFYGLVHQLIETLVAFGR
jgi:Zn-dependent protease with chaperone function